MEKMRKILISLFFASIMTLFLAFVSAQTNPWSAGSSGAEKNTFTTLEDVYVKSNPICEPATEVDLYIVKNNDNWTAGESFEDVRNASQNITLKNSIIPLTKIWSKPKGGDYDIVIDCNKNGVYDEFIDKIDNFYNIGFKVTSVAGTGKAELGKKSIGNHSWQYDPESPSLANEMIQLSLLASGEDIELENITIRASGTGNDTEIDTLEIYIDENNNSKLDEEETMIGDIQPAYTEDNSVTSIPLDYFLTKDLVENILVVYTLKETTAKGEFSLKVESIYGLGTDSNKVIKLSGLPLNSGTKTILPQKTCLGSLTLQLEPTPAPKNSKVTAKMNNLTGCQNKTISLRTSPCGSSLIKEIRSCSPKNEGCEVSFNASASETYHACIDKNSDSDFIDFGEYAFTDLVIATEEVIEEEKAKENITAEEVNITEEIKEEKNITEEISGNVIKGLEEKLLGADGGFLILLEVTLLLILFVLIMILFKLKKYAIPPTTSEKTSEKTKGAQKTKEKEEE